MNKTYVIHKKFGGPVMVVDGEYDLPDQPGKKKVRCYQEDNSSRIQPLYFDPDELLVLQTRPYISSLTATELMKEKMRRLETPADQNFYGKPIVPPQGLYIFMLTIRPRGKYGNSDWAKAFNRPPTTEEVVQILQESIRDDNREFLTACIETVKVFKVPSTYRMPSEGYTSPIPMTTLSIELTMVRSRILPIPPLKDEPGDGPTPDHVI